MIKLNTHVAYRKYKVKS